MCDEIDFKDETLDLNERLWSTAFSQLMLAYGSDWESQVNEGGNFGDGFRHDFHARFDVFSELEESCSW